MEKRKGLQAALSYVQQGKLDQAVAEYQAILRADPNNCNVLNSLGDLSVRMGHKAEAIGYFKRLGEVYRLDGLHVRAIAVYKKVLKLDPAHAEASLACAEMYAEQGLTAEAKLQFQALADQSVKRGDTFGALEIYGKLILVEPGHPPTLSKVVGLLAKAGRLDQALAKLKTLEDRLIAAGRIDDIRHIYQKTVELLTSQRRGAEATLLTERLATLDPSAAEAKLDQALSAAFPGMEHHPEPVAGMKSPVEETPSLEILPGPSEVQEESPALAPVEEIGGWFDGAPGGVVKEIAEEVEERAAPILPERDVAVEEEGPSAGAIRAAAIELDPHHASETVTPELEPSPTPGELVESQTVAEELQEAQFYLDQGMLQEARNSLQRILRDDPEHSAAKQHLAEIERGADRPKWEADRPKREEHPKAAGKKRSVFRVEEAKASQEEYVDFAGELSEALSEDEDASLPSDLEPEVKQLLHELQRGIRDQLDAADYETHYDLAIAFKDLGLYDRAIGELRLAANDAAYQVRCASLLGLCYLVKGEPERAVEELLKGVAATEAGTEERWGILYDLATAYEALGNGKKALETLLAIQSEMPKFRDIRVRVRDLRGRLEASRGSSR
jgi:tetratricopeptide (TPR) repeat protein